MPRYRQIEIVSIGWFCIVAACFCLGCSDNSVTHTDEATTAWSAFEAEEYDDAISSFHAVIASDSASAGAYAGLGWSFAFNGALDSATHYFVAALEIDSTLADAHAGLSAVCLAAGLYDDAITGAQTALGIDSEWSFAHDPTIDYYDLHLILAESFYALGESRFAGALAEVRIMNPGTSLSPDDSETWHGHPTFAAALLKEIEMLEEIIGADMNLP